MKEIVYSVFRTIQEITSGEYKGYKYAIMNYGTSPAAYVGIPDGHPLRGNRTLVQNVISCHGGVTFMENFRGATSRKKAPHIAEIFKDQFVIGWDYAHYGDFIAYLSDSHKGKMWTSEEIFEEVKNVIGQLKNLEVHAG